MESNKQLMKKRILIIVLLVIVYLPLCGQIRLSGYQSENVNPALYMGSTLDFYA